MARGARFKLVFAPDVRNHLDFIDKKHHRLLQKVISEQLTFQPGMETRNRKPLEQPAPFAATWELRCGPNNRFRVYYNIDPVNAAVNVLAIGVKDRNVVRVRGQEFS
jgi:mRNA-degrading endonuclease RelE of RelBE toxin-antitoxin system